MVLRGLKTIKNNPTPGAVVLFNEVLMTSDTLGLSLLDKKYGLEEFPHG